VKRCKQNALHICGQATVYYLTQAARKEGNRLGQKVENLQGFYGMKKLLLKSLKKIGKRMAGARLVDKIVSFQNRPDLDGRPSREVAATLISKVAPLSAGISFFPGSALLLTTLELALISRIARIYGVDEEEATRSMRLGHLAINLGASRTTRWAAESFQVVPFVGSVAKGIVGGGAVFLIGHSIINWFEKNYPARTYRHARDTAKLAA
jgi:uncharacterized protein (DUF697 family)